MYKKMDEEDLKTIVKYRAKGNKNFKNYDAIVTEAVKGKYITVEMDMVGYIVLLWDSFMFVSDIFGNTITCDYKVTRDFTAKKVTTGGKSSLVVKRKQSGKLKIL